MDNSAASYEVRDVSQKDELLGDQAPAAGLTRIEHEILIFERQWWKYAGSKDTAIKELFNLSATRYYQILNKVIDNPAALACDPLLVKRLRRIRTSRQKFKAARKLGIDLSGI